MQRQIPFAAGFVIVGLVVAVAAGCGGNSKKSSSTTTTAATATTTPAVDKKIAAEVPAATKSKGTIVVATFPHYAPDEFIASDGKTVGMDPDLGKALAGVMGLKVKVVNTSFDRIIPGVSSGKYDLGMSSITDTKQREKTVDFVTHFKAGTTFFTNATGGLVIQHGLSDLCGHSVAVARGTTQQRDATAQSAKCKAAGKVGVKVFVYPNLNAVSLAVKRGRGRIGMADSPVAAYLVVTSNGLFKLTGTPYNVAPYGIAIPKGSMMAKPVLDALKVLMADGTYRAILSRWYILSGAITNPQINGAIS
jgi:polar amino acid transport system substrate-binding protein